MSALGQKRTLRSKNLMSALTLERTLISGRRSLCHKQTLKGHSLGLQFRLLKLKRSIDRESDDVVATLERKVGVTAGGDNDILLAVHRVRCRG